MSEFLMIASNGSRVAFQIMVLAVPMALVFSICYVLTRFFLSFVGGKYEKL